MPPNENTPATVLSIVGISLGSLSLLTCVFFFVSIPFALVGLVLCVIAHSIATERWQSRVSIIGIILSIIGLLIPVGFVILLIVTSDPNEPETWGHLNQTNATTPIGPLESDVDPQDR
ncbi:MAG: hypothetical protein CMJ40_03980 [Phycisphaerae bacterium]|nr:hypothetical protein [Phycisphaerae bacterium]|tara:strand:- start:760 stop:1113 length:354 start_codon:yes stop_codon:yes gene_type:complete